MLEGAVNSQEKTVSVMGRFYGFILLLHFIGLLCWLYLSVKVGSIAMFMITWVPLFTTVCAGVGLWSVGMGVPSWIYALFS